MSLSGMSLSGILSPGRRTVELALLVAAAMLAAIAAISPPDIRRALANSATLAVGAAAIALPLGTLLAILLTRYDIPGRRILIACLGALLFLPLYVHLSGWDAALGKLGWYSLATGSLADPLLSGMRGAIWVHGMAAVPWTTLIVAIGLSQVDPIQEEAALLVAPPRQVLWRITLPQTLPFVLAAAIWTIVSTTSEMTVTNIYLINPSQWTYTERFYMRYASSDAQQAALAVLPGVAGLATIIALTLWMISRLSNPRLFSITRPLVFSQCGRRDTAAVATWLMVIALLGVPVFSLLTKVGFVVRQDGAQRVKSWSLFAGMSEIGLVPRRFGPEIWETVLVAASAATMALLVGTFLAWRARRGGTRSILAAVATVLGLAVPGPLVGAGLIWLLNRDLPPAISTGDGTSKSWFLLLYDHTAVAPILAQSIRALPLMNMLLWYSFATLNSDVLSAAALDGCTPWRVFWKIAAPQRWRAMVAGWVAGFAVAAGDLAWAHLVTPPGLDLLQRRVFGLVHSGVEEQVAAISLVVMMVYGVLAAVFLKLLRR